MAAYLYAVVGSPGSGKDLIIRAVNDLGKRHAVIVPKHTDRGTRRDEGNEMFFEGDKKFDLDNCDVTYHNFNNKYGLKSKEIWRNLQKGISQVAVVSNIEAINQLSNIFGNLLILLYVHSETTHKDFESQEKKLNDKDSSYVKNRSKAEAYKSAFNLYSKNITKFSHVLIYAGNNEDLYDQIFRVFDTYKSK